MKHVTVTSALKLTDTQEKAIRQTLQLTATDEVAFLIDPAVIAGMKIVVDGRAFDLTVKHQLAEIAQE